MQRSWRSSPGNMLLTSFASTSGAHVKESYILTASRSMLAINILTFLLPASRPSASKCTRKSRLYVSHSLAPVLGSIGFNSGRVFILLCANSAVKEVDFWHHVINWLRKPWCSRKLIYFFPSHYRELHNKLSHTLHYSGSIYNKNHMDVLLLIHYCCK